MFGASLTGTIIPVSEETLKEVNKFMSALEKQVGGNHYKDLPIQPIEYIHANGIPFAEGSVIKDVTRWRETGGIKDLEKAKHFLELLIELESGQVEKQDWVMVSCAAKSEKGE